MSVASERKAASGLLRKLVAVRQGTRSLATFNLVSQFPGVSPIAVELSFGVLCTLSGIGLRWVIDRLWDGAGPFGLMVPFVLLATLFGRWPSGLLTAALSSLYAWYYVLPINASWAFEKASDGPRVVVNILAALFVVALAEAFRRTMWQALRDRDVLLHEIEHRVKNNFASVSALLRLQMRDHAEDSTIITALQSALGRVESYAIVNSFLYRGTEYTGTVNLKAYLNELCDSIEQSVPSSRSIRITSDVASFDCDRDRAIIFGLLINELVTNALKYAFAGRPGGEIEVRMKGDGHHWRLEVSDNGVGINRDPDARSFGSKLVSALAGQLGADIELASSEKGTRYVFERKN